MMMGTSPAYASRIGICLMRLTSERMHFALEQ